MTSTSNGPKKPYKTPLGRRLKYLVQDTGHAAKKATRKVTDPVRDARARSSRPAKPKATRDEKTGTAPSVPRRREPGARELGERPVAPERRRPATRREQEARRAGKRRGRRARRRALPKPTAAGTAAAITRFGDRSSRFIRGAVAPLGPPLVTAGAFGRRALAWLARVVTPLRAALFVAAAAAILLGISQFADYRGVAVGVPDYAAFSDAELVAPAPQVDRQEAGSAHAYVLVPVAVIALALLFLCARGRWQLGLVVSLLGLFGVAVSLIVDVASGLDESVQAIAYEGVEARLLEGFWVQLFAAGVLVAGGLLVTRYGRRNAKRVPKPRRRRAQAVGPARASAT
jgi:hypothetical protein